MYTYLIIIVLHILKNKIMIYIYHVITAMLCVYIYIITYNSIVNNIQDGSGLVM